MTRCVTAGKAFNEVKDERNEADYNVTIMPSPDEARDALEAAVDFLDLCGWRYGFGLLESRESRQLAPEAFR